MKSWLPKNIFAVNRCSSIGAKEFNHCSSLCPHGDGVLLAWYSGSGECRDDQSVYVTYLSNDKKLTPIRIGDKTGNPIIWNEGEKTWLLWSQFEDTQPIANLAHRWRHCSLWIQEVTVSDRIELSEPIQIARPTQNLLARTNPIVIGQNIMLPLYDEVRRECVIFSGKDGHFEELSRYGDNIIQPAIWAEGKRIHSLSRNFGNRKKQSIHFYSDDACKTWQYSGPSFFKNTNNSIAVNFWTGQNIALWNDCNSIYRTDMTLGIIVWELGVPRPFVIKVINRRHGSYPCLCVDNNDRLHFAFTDPQRRIEHHVWNKKTFKQELKRSRNTTRRT